MILSIDSKLLTDYLKSNEDCEEIAAGEFVADFYDCDKPITLNLKLEKQGYEVIAAAFLVYDSEQDGWYMGDRIDDAAFIEAVIKQAING